MIRIEALLPLCVVSWIVGMIIGAKLLGDTDSPPCDNHRPIGEVKYETELQVAAAPPYVMYETAERSWVLQCNTSECGADGRSKWSIELVDGVRAAKCEDRSR